jgi:hypothetical protein
MHQKEVLIAHSRTDDLNTRPPLISQYLCAPAKTSAVFPRHACRGSADEVRLDVRQLDVIGPALGTDRDVVAATVISAIDQHLADAGCAHFAEGDFLRAGGSFA